MSNLWSGVIDTHNEYIKFSEISGVTFEEGKTYIIQINGSCTLIESSALPTDGGFLVNTLIPVAYTKGSGDLYVKGESYFCTLNLAEGVSSGGGGSANIESLSVTPTTSAQTITASGGVDGYSPVEVSAVTAAIDANIVAGNIKKDVQILGVTGTLEAGGDFQLTRVKDDNNNEIGTHICNFTDANGNTFKVVLLDAQYRLASAQWLSYTDPVPNMPLYSDLATSNVWEAKETATQNTQLILDYCTASGGTSTACMHCRSKSFVINSVTYYGQLPNVIEASEIAKNYNIIETMDTSASTNPSLNFSTSRNMWSSSQAPSSSAWRLRETGYINDSYKLSNLFVCPVLEIPA